MFSFNLLERWLCTLFSGEDLPVCKWVMKDTPKLTFLIGNFFESKIPLCAKALLSPTIQWEGGVEMFVQCVI